MLRSTRLTGSPAGDPSAPRGSRAGIGLPARIVCAEGLTAQAVTRHGACALDLMRTGPLRVGTWVLALNGAARSVIGVEQARKIDDALDLLDAIARGDLEAAHASSGLAHYFAALQRHTGSTHLE
jgi:hydrogenase maturation factor